MMSLILRSPLTRRVALGIFLVGLSTTVAVPAWADAKRTYFTATETILGGTPPTIIPAGDKFHVIATQVAAEDATDPRVSGSSTIVANAVWELPAMIGPMWGTFRLVNAGGEWNGHWVGSRTMTSDGIATWVASTCVGSGAYAGLVARWTLRGLNVGPDNPYLYADGFIVEASPRRWDLPMTWRATRTESLNVETLDFQILTETGQGTHIGRATNAGFGFLVPTGPAAAAVTGMGQLTAPTGELLYWVVSGMADLTGQSGTIVSVYFTGGTGKFDGASGQLNGTVFASFGPPDADNVALATFDYELSGTIRY